MSSRFSTLLCLIATASSALGGIDFTAAEGERKLCGRVFKQLIFRQDGQKITYEQPPGWSYRGDGSRMLFTPPAVAMASSRIEQKPLQTPLSFDEPTLQALQAEVIAALPGGTQSPTVVSAEVNPFKVNGHETFELVVSYHDQGAEFQASVLFVNTPRLLLQFCTTARKVDFDKLHAAFRSSIFSWEWHKAERPAVPHIASK